MLGIEACKYSIDGIRRGRMDSDVHTQAVGQAGQRVGQRQLLDAVLRRQLVYVAVSRASQAVTLQAGAPGAGASALADQQLWSNWLQAES